MPELAGWDSFYVIVGSSAGALIGLQFVVLTLIAERPPMRVAEAGAAFITPTIVHFSAVLLLAALARVPWPTADALVLAWGTVGILAIVYVAIVSRRMATQKAYRPAGEDYFFYLMLPMAAYVLLLASAAIAMLHTTEGLFGVGAATLLLMFVAIRNAWDGIAYHVFHVRGPGPEVRYDGASPKKEGPP